MTADVTRPARITVLGVLPGTPPFRPIEIDGELVGRATSLADVVLMARDVAIAIHDLDDPAEVR
ncbi:hypothetical protein [Streptomyces sp. NPDC013457]|uniref:hypothetical protein n=1 Tax=Streptomyces sp. NPDC013457 TaxID=3364866 RepID=UPI003702ED31